MTGAPPTPFGTASGAEALVPGKRHQQGLAGAKADDFGSDRAHAAAMKAAAIADGEAAVETVDLDQQADDAADPTEDGHIRQAVDGADGGGDGGEHGCGLSCWSR